MEKPAFCWEICGRVQRLKIRGRLDVPTGCCAEPKGCAHPQHPLPEECTTTTKPPPTVLGLVLLHLFSPYLSTFIIL